MARRVARACAARSGELYGDEGEAGAVEQDPAGVYQVPPLRVSRMSANRWQRALAMPGGNSILLNHHVWSGR
jgi:hypothetical protein